MKKYDVVVIGHLSLDENTSQYGTKVVPGGSAYLVAAPGSLFSKKVGLVSRIGDDYDISNLEKWINLDLKGVKRIPGGKSSRFFHKYLTRNHSERDWKAQFNVGVDVSENDIPHEYLDSKYIYIATMPPRQQMPIIDYIRDNSNAITAADTIENYVEKYPALVRRVFESVDIIFMDEREWNLMNKLHGKNVLIKKAAHGASFIFQGREYRVPATRVERVVDKTGAGDVLAGVFLANLASSKSIQESLELGTKFGTESIKGFGIEHLLDLKFSEP